MILVLGAALSACAAPVSSESKLGTYAYAVSDYLYSPLREQNDDGMTREEIVSDCMKDQGFDYRVPKTPVSDSETGDTPPGSQFDIPDASIQGYGLVFSYSEFGEPESESGETVEDDPEDPLASLTPTEADAYGVALYGSYADDLTADPEAEWDWTRAGCLGLADHELSSEQAGAHDNPFKELMNAVLETPMQVLDGAGWHKVLGEWAACMSSEGYAGLQTLDDASASIERERDDLLRSERPPISTGETVTVTDANDGVPSRAEWEALRRREVKLATTDQTCRNTADLEQQYERLYAEVEARFLAGHQAELDKMMVWISENSK